MKNLAASLSAFPCRIRKFGKRQDGVTMIEYALISALIAVVLVAVLTSLGTELGSTFTKIKSALTTANAG